MSSTNTSTPAGGKAAPTHPSSTGPTHPNATRPPTGSPRATTAPFSPDEKTGDAYIKVHPVNNDSSEKSPTQETTEVSTEDPITIFHSALGIPEPKTQKPSFFKKLFRRGGSQKDPGKLNSANEGVYKKVLSCERNTRYKYYFCSWVVTIAMFLQIVVGASVTAFGAGSASHVLITAFGAANTALASLLAVLKSQGLPNRIRQDWNMWRELREFIEAQERGLDLNLSGKVEGSKEKLDNQAVWDLVKKIEARYRAVRNQIETNRPDTYIPLEAIEPQPPSKK
jgi:hypothetical protein